jgi:hypothetical protein
MLTPNVYSVFWTSSLFHYVLIPSPSFFPFQCLVGFIYAVSRLHTCSVFWSFPLSSVLYFSLPASHWFPQTVFHSHSHMPIIIHIIIIIITITILGVNSTKEWENMHYLAFTAWLTSLKLIYSSIHFPENDIISFFFIYE